MPLAAAALATSLEDSGDTVLMSDEELAPAAVSDREAALAQRPPLGEGGPSPPSIVMQTSASHASCTDVISAASSLDKVGRPLPRACDSIRLTEWPASMSRSAIAVPIWPSPQHADFHDPPPSPRVRAHRDVGMLTRSWSGWTGKHPFPCSVFD